MNHLWHNKVRYLALRFVEREIIRWMSTRIRKRGGEVYGGDFPLIVLSLLIFIMFIKVFVGDIYFLFRLGVCFLLDWYRNSMAILMFDNFEHVFH